jgi:hypothetical protein
MLGYNHHCHCRDHDDTGVGAIMFAIVCLLIAALSFAVAIVAAHLFVVSTFLLRLMERRWWKAGWWFSVFLFLLALDGYLFV